MAVLNIPFLLVPGAQLIVPEAQHRQPMIATIMMTNLCNNYDVSHIFLVKLRIILIKPMCRGLNYSFSDTCICH